MRALVKFGFDIETYTVFFSLLFTSYESNVFDMGFFSPKTSTYTCIVIIAVCTLRSKKKQKTNYRHYNTQNTDLKMR